MKTLSMLCQRGKFGIVLILYWLVRIFLNLLKKNTSYVQYIQVDCWMKNIQRLHLHADNVKKQRYKYHLMYMQRLYLV